MSRPKLEGPLEQAEKLARRVACPLCDAAPGDCCRSVGGAIRIGQALSGCHIVRWERAVELLRLPKAPAVRHQAKP